MDPLSITGTVVSLTAACLQTAKALNDLKGKYANASLTISAICTETTVISACLTHIQSSMLSSQQSLSAKLTERPDLEATLDQALTGCYVVFDVLQAEVTRLSEGAEIESSNLGFRQKLRVVWNEVTMQDILSQMRGLETALTLLLHDTMADLKQLMDNNTTVLQQIAHRTSRLRTVRASTTPQSIFDMSFITQSIHSGDGSSVFSSTLFSFDDEIVNSQIYRRTLAKAYANSQKDNQSNDANPDKEQSANQSGTQTSTELTSKNSPHDGIDNSTILLTDEKKDHRTTAADASTSPNILVVETAPEDRFMTFMTVVEDEEPDWATFWSVKREDIEGRSKKEIERQNILHEIITSEKAYLESLQCYKYLYTYRFLLDPSIATALSANSRKQDFIFRPCEEIYQANKLLLYDQLKSRQSSDGMFISAVSDIFLDWLQAAGQFYIDYATEFPGIRIAIQKEARKNARFARFLEQGREHERSRRLGWEIYLKSPVTRLQRYHLILSTLLKYSLKSNPYHKYEELERLLDALRKVLVHCDEAVSKRVSQFEIDDIRSGLGSDGPRLLPQDVEVRITKGLTYKENRFRTATDMVLLIVTKPTKFVAVLKESRSELSQDTSYEVFLKLRPAEARAHTRSKRDSSQPYLCQIHLEGLNENKVHTAITLNLQDRDEASAVVSAIPLPDEF